MCQQFRYVLLDTWYSAAENMVFVVKNLNKHFVGIAQSPTKMERSQKNHLFAAMFGLAQPEKLKIAHRMNHFELKHKVCLKALKAAWEEIQSLKCHTVNELYSPNF